MSLDRQTIDLSFRRWPEEYKRADLFRQFQVSCMMVEAWKNIRDVCTSLSEADERTFAQECGRLVRLRAELLAIDEPEKEE